MLHRTKAILKSEMEKIFLYSPI